MKTNRTGLSLVVASAALALAGCGSADDMSSGDQQKMRDAMSPTRKEGVMTSDQKTGFERWKAGGSPTGAPGTSAAPAVPATGG